MFTLCGAVPCEEDLTKQTVAALIQVSQRTLSQWQQAQPCYRPLVLARLTSKQLLSFSWLLLLSPKKAQLVISKKYYLLLDPLMLAARCLAWSDAAWGHLHKLCHNNLADVLRLYQAAQTSSLTTSNVKSLLALQSQACWGLNKKVSWGVGNHASVEENIEAHYQKHVLDPEEGKYWHDLGVSKLEEYRDYATQHFKKEEMERICLHTNGVEVYVSGFLGKVFLIARYTVEGLSISSCYYVLSGEKPGRLQKSALVLRLN